MRAEQRELVAEKRDLESEIAVVLQPLHAPVRSGNTILRVKKKKKRSCIGKKHLVTTLQNCGQLKDPSMAAEVVKFIYDARTVSEDFEVTRDDPK